LKIKETQTGFKICGAYFERSNFFSHELKIWRILNSELKDMINIQKMKDEIEIAKETFTECARKKNCDIPTNGATPAQTETIEFPKIKLSEFLKISGKRFKTKNIYCKKARIPESY